VSEQKAEALADKMWWPARLAHSEGDDRDAIAALLPYATALVGLAEALEWLTNLAHCVGKDGGLPQEGEWSAAAKSGRSALAAYSALEPK
jgi:hypothetical protein